MRAEVGQTIHRRRNTDPALASYAQQGLWFTQAADADSGAYHNVSVWRLGGNLDRGALAESLGTIVRRHEALRTRFQSTEDGLFQVIAPETEFVLSDNDLSRRKWGLGRFPSLTGLLRDLARRPFDLATELPIRATLIHLSPRQHLLALVLHHIASDGWSIGIFLGELSVAYGAFLNHQVPVLPKLPFQYVDFADWERQRVLSGEMAANLAFWERGLPDQDVVAQIQPDRTAAPDSPRGSIHRFRIGSALMSRLRAIGTEQNATPFMVLLAGMEVLLHRYTGLEDFSVGMAVANRLLPETHNLIGYFANTLVHRADVSGNPSFKDLLRRVQLNSLDALERQDTPFALLVERLNRKSDHDRAPFFKIMIVHQSAKAGTPVLSGLSVSEVPFHNGSAKFDLTIALTEISGAVVGTVEYRKELYEARSIRGLFRQYTCLLQAVARQPDALVSQLPLTEPHRYRVRPARRRGRIPRSRSINDLFEMRVRRSPDAVALIADGRAVTYRRLEQMADRVAATLLASGVREARVCVCAERTPQMIAALLGILKTGSAYVPLDPRDPSVRLEGLVSDSGAVAIVTQESLRTRFPATAVPIIILDTLPAVELVNPLPSVSPEMPAYVMFTSGTTGRPKGVVVSHRAVVCRVYGLPFVRSGHGKTFLHHSSIAFDASTYEVWVPLLRGGRLSLLRDAIPTISGLRTVIADSGVTDLWLTAALFNTIVDEAVEILRPVQHLVIGGEALSVRHVRNALAMLRGTKLINGYGPTETTTFACCYPIPPRLPMGAPSVPIGRPIGNTHVYVVDRYMNPVPAGSPGELLIGGSGLANGYLEAPELTNQRFILDPFSSRRKQRLYRTGDIVRQLPSGDLAFLGRLDAQIKIRGYRIEPGEVQRALARHVSISQSVVLLAGDQPDRTFLVAYVVSATAAGIDAARVRQDLRQWLPGYLVPHMIVEIPAIPRSTNGKVDRSALPVPDLTLSRDRAHESPRTELELQVAEVWRDILALDEVGVG